MASVSEFLIERLENANIKHVFGVPGDYVLNFYKKLNDCESIELINSTDENHAGFSADGYARVNGIGCVCVTYNVGALKLANAVACAYAERSPVIVISGSPGMKERKEGMLLHHMVRSFECQKEIFSNITCASIVLDNPNTAGFKIDEAMELLNYHKQPIYIELPRDVADKPIGYDVYKQGTPSSPKSDEENLTEALEEINEWIVKAENPVILAGVQLARIGMGSALVNFAEKHNIPIATTLLSKSVVGERHPLFAGVYSGAASQEGVQDIVEKSDCLLMLGVMITDMTTCFKPICFKKRNVISATIESLKVKNHTFTNVVFKDFVTALFKSNIERKKDTGYKPASKKDVKYVAQKDTPLTISRLFSKINDVLDKNMAIVADIGDALFGAADLVVHHRNHFLSPAFYTSMGFAIPAALGVQTALPNVRPIVLVGDGAFQMSCNELGTIVARELNPIIFVLDNKGFTTERFLLDGTFNDIPKWKYDKIVDMLGGGLSFTVLTETELDDAIEVALSNKEMTIINVQLEPDDISDALKRMTDGLSKRV